MHWINSIKKTAVLLFCAAYTVSAQDKHCGSTEVYNKYISEHPEVLKKEKELELFTQQYTGSSKKTEGQVYIIPIVFHILHEYGTENISDDQVKDAVRILNEDYRKLNTDITDVVAAFQGITADCEIEFRLANKDPNGNCTNGIERIISPLTYSGGDDAKLNQWPRDKYLNVWSVHTFDTVNHKNVAGYSYYPSSTTWDPSIDGVIILSDYIGSIGTGNLTRARALTHEIGHYLNLEHPWGSTNSPGVTCGDDAVSDTPITKGWTTCNLTHSAVCNANIQENVQNYMDYSYCTRMYTEGQKSRMRAALNSSIASRNNLWSAANLTATGTATSTPTTCAPNADFNPEVTVICSGSQMHFKDLSWNGTPTSWFWNFEGGTPSTSTVSNPAVQYSAAGTYNVTLVASNSGGSGTKTKTGVITVFPGTAMYSSWQYSDSYEYDTFPNVDWKAHNSLGHISWHHTNAVAANGVMSVMIQNYSNTPGQVDEMISPSIDLSTIADPYLYFKVANAQKNSSSNDKLEVSLSTNCGETWTLLYFKAGNNLSTGGIMGNEFYPNQAQWKQEFISLSFYASKQNVYFRFKFTGGGGNDVYIDDFHVVGPSGINEVEANLNFSVFPNPADESASVSFYLTRKQQVHLKIYDLLGKEIETLNNNETLEPGEHNYEVRKNEKLTAGMYLAKLQIGQQEFYRKVVFR